MTNPTPSPVDRAALLGAEHGAQAAEEWLTGPNHHGQEGCNSYHQVNGLVLPEPWPTARVPDEGSQRMKLEYVAAFRAAVESTIRQACQEVTP